MYWQDKQLKYESSKQTDRAILAEHVRKEKEAAKQGKQPFYLKKCNALSSLVFIILNHMFGIAV